MGVLRAPRLGPFFVAVVLVWTSHAALQGFISLRIIDLGGDATMVAATWSLGALLEVFLMSAFPIFARRFGAERLVVVGAFAFAVRALISAVVDVPLVIVAASLFGGVGFTFVYVGTVTWVSRAVDRRVQATAQGIFTGTANGIGTIGGSIIGGALGGTFGLQVLFGLAAFGYAAGGVVAWLAVARRPAAPVRPPGA
jgi:MFS family permease